VDTTLRRKTWYIGSTLAMAAGLLAIGTMPTTAASLGAMTALVLAANFASTVIGTATESLIAHSTPDDQKGRASGWFQAGNLGGVGLGGGAGLWLEQHAAQPWMAAAVLASACAACCLALWYVPEPVPAYGGDPLPTRLMQVLRELWGVARSRGGALALLIVFLPLGTGAAQNLWPVIAGQWRAGADTVALTSGVLSGLVAAAGCLVAGPLCDRIDRKFAYALFGALLGLCALGMALAPRTEAMFIVFTLAYAFIGGLCYAGFSAVVLEAIGRGAAATKYSLFASLSNMPIGAMTALDGWTQVRWGSAAMLGIEALIGLAAIGLFFAVRHRAGGDAGVAVAVRA
jgi:MFS family permease